MGSGASYPTTQFVHPFSNEMYTPFGASRMDSEKLNSDNTLQQYNVNLIDTPFAGIWSVKVPDSIAPRPRSGHFTYYDEPNHTVYIGYGSFNSQLFNDLWAFDTLNDTWRKIPLTGDEISCRSGTRASFYSNHLILFGGYCEPDYFGDLHTIDVNTGERRLLATNGIPPSPRSSPIVAVYKNKLFVWGGFNQEWPSELNILDLDTLTWTNIDQLIHGRTAVPWVLDGNILYSFGGSKVGTMFCLDMETNEITMKQTTGSAPTSSIMGAGMVRVEHYVFFFGGRSNNNQYTLVYACDLNKMWWFVFHIMPDGKTVSIQDGVISQKSGRFMLPRIHSFSVCYIKEKREILSFLGYPENDPPQLNVINIAESMSFIHLREDMVSVLNY
ncbi:Kelch motif family protein [Histomonas meleagridis]|uniref:Kelch motif family protein n=1 Tax=Histomonas meleagridis TaxID=135588 RepID=UPI0035599D0D|nr:Kelch motif family protein [Histomonas meleagridis]KAH0797740.1 Kelch motif family protein [Histomonas meleagridis]